MELRKLLLTLFKVCAFLVITDKINSIYVDAITESPSLKINGSGDTGSEQKAVITDKEENVVLDSRVLTTHSDLNDLKSKDIGHSNNDNSVTKSWSIGREQSGSKFNILTKVDVLYRILNKLKNEYCKKDLISLLDALASYQTWSLQMVDSTAKLASGLLRGNLYQLGDFDECIEAKIPANFTGQYCLADVRFHFNGSSNESSLWRKTNLTNENNRATFDPSLSHWAVCIPSTCSRNDTEILVEEVFSMVESFQTISVRVDDNKCYKKEPIVIGAKEIVFGSILGIYLLFVTFATILHAWIMTIRKNCVVYSIDSIKSKNSSVWKESILSFSVLRTVKNFLHVKPNELNLECIGGIKSLSMMLIVAGHSLLFIFGGPIANTSFFETMYIRFENGILLNGPLLVDTFLLISGFLMCRLLLLELEKRNGKINFLMLYIMRYIRLTPSYLVVLGFYITWMSKLGTGPLWKEVVDNEANRCQRSWWTNLLYVNNYVKTDSLCMFQSWYLAVDYHLFIVAPFIVYSLWRWRIPGKILIFICIAVSIAFRFYVTYKEKLDPTLLAFPPELQDLAKNHYFINYYIKSHLRATSYFIGLLFGYLVHRLQSKGSRIPNALSWVGWPVAFILGVGSMYSILPFYSYNPLENGVENAAYASLHSVGWCLAIGWVIVSCVTENGGAVNKFLSWKFFIPLSRLTYCAYLINGFIVLYNKGVIREPMYLSIYELMCKVFGHVVMTFFGAFVMCVLFESPIHGVEKILLKRVTYKEEKDSTTTILSRPRSN